MRTEEETKKEIEGRWEEGHPPLLLLTEEAEVAIKHGK